MDGVFSFSASATIESTVSVVTASRLPPFRCLVLVSAESALWSPEAAVCESGLTVLPFTQPIRRQRSKNSTETQTQPCATQFQPEIEQECFYFQFRPMYVISHARQACILLLFTLFHAYFTTVIYFRKIVRHFAELISCACFVSSESYLEFCSSHVRYLCACFSAADNLSDPHVLFMLVFRISVISGRSFADFIF